MPLHAEAIAVMTDALRRLEGMVTPPQRVPIRDSFVYRYPDKGIKEAIVQKLARSISGLNAVSVLLQAGHVQEVGVLLRTLDEIQEDIMFLVTAETSGGQKDRHRKYLDAFYAEPVFSRPEGSLDMQKPDLLPRRKIRSHTVNTLGEGMNKSQALAASEALSTAYSGYVHANSECIMDMYGGEQPHFHVNGMRGTPRIESTARDAQNYVYRGLMATAAAANVFHETKLIEGLMSFVARYEFANGHR